MSSEFAPRKSRGDLDRKNGKFEKTNNQLISHNKNHPTQEKEVTVIPRSKKEKGKPKKP